MSKSHKSAGSLNYTPELDGMRAFAVIFVLISHIGLGETFEPLVKILPWGHIGVQIFFVLSGFLITNILVGCRDKEISITKAGRRRALKSFYIRRFLRIFPLYYATIAIVFYFGSPDFHSVIGFHLFFLSNLPSAIYSEPLATGNLLHAASAHFWNLAVEEQFYIFWPLVVLSMSKRSLINVAIALVLLSPIFRATFFIIGFSQPTGYLPANMDALGAGALLAFYRNRWLSMPSIISIRFVNIIAISIFTSCITFYILGILFKPFWVVFPLSEAILYAFLINKILDGKLHHLSNILKINIFVITGKISFGIYLTHTFISDFVKYNIINISDTSQFMQSIISFMFIIAFCLATWHIFEKPINNFKSHFPYSNK